MKSRLSVLMVVDLVDYTRMMEADRDAAVAAVRELRTERLEPVAIEHGGEVLKRMGDGWIIAFPSVSASIRAAQSVQTALAGHRTIKLRIGIHLGEITEDEDDFYGPGVNIAARIQTEAPPGGMMITQDLFRQLDEAQGAGFTDAGSYRLKNIALPVTLYQWRPQIAGATGAGEVPTIAVHPFACAPDDSETRATAGDLRDELIVRLSRRTGIRVLDASGSATRKAIYDLRGRLRIGGTRGRLAMSMSLRDGGDTVWSETYEGDTSDIFALCDTLVERADMDLRLQINAFDGDRIAHLPDEALNVAELRSRAASSSYRLSLDAWEYSRSLLNRALRLKPDDPMALAMRAEAESYVAAARHATLSPEVSARLQRDLNAAVEALPQGDYIFFARSMFRVFVSRDAAGALADSAQALALNPGYAPGYEQKGAGLMLSGRFVEGAEALERSLGLGERDPFALYRAYLAAVAWLAAGEAGRSLARLDTLLHLRPDERGLWLLRAECLQVAGDADGADAARAEAGARARLPSCLTPRPPLPDALGALADRLNPAA